VRANKIIMAEFSDENYDARVRKEALSLASAGYDLHLYMYKSGISSFQKYDRDGIQYHLFPMIGRYENSSLLQKVKKYARMIVTILKINIVLSLSKADVYHLHNLFCAPGILIGKLRNRSKLVYDSHEVRLERLKNVQSFEKYIFSIADLSFTASPIRSKLIERSYKIVEPEYLLNCPPLSIIGKLKADDSIANQGKDKILIFSGNFLLHTRLQDKVIEALLYLPKNVKFHLMGYGNNSEVDLMFEIAERFDLSERLILLDPVSVDEVVQSIATADIGISLLRDVNMDVRYPALNKFYEYLAAGLAILASDNPGFKKDIYDNPIGQVGEVCDGTDPKSIAKAISLMIEDEDNLKQMRKNSKQLFINHWNWDIQEKKLLNLYRNRVCAEFVE